MWVLLTAAVMLSFEAHREPLQNVERIASGFSACALTSIFVHRLIQSSIKQWKKNFDLSGSIEPATQHNLRVQNSGVVFAAMIVNLISAATNWIMFFFDTPILVDQLTGCQVYMVRWCEWVVLAFLMTFLIESVDSSSDGKDRVTTGLGLATAQGLCCLCGLLFPIVSSSVKDWVVMLVFAFANFFTLFPRLKEKIVSTKTARAKVKALRDASSVVSFEQYEDLERREYGLFLFRACVVAWSLYVLSFCLEALGLVPPHGMKSHFVVDCVVDLIAKLLYHCVIVDSYAELFDMNRAVSEARYATALTRRHEIEKLDVATTTAREVDKKASHFERHEVKNGLLASIDLLESLTDAQARRRSSTSRVVDVASHQEDEAENASLSELNNTLVEMLNTVISEVNMTRATMHVH